jgi:hypothetical protein
MRFFIHGAVLPEAPAALAKRAHVCHGLPELAADAQALAAAEHDPAVLLALLGQRQWHLLTTDAALVRDLYEQKTPFGGVIVLLLPDPDVAHDQGRAIARLFERYQRLTPGRLYTVTPNRVKIRQLPGAGAHRA